MERHDFFKVELTKEVDILSFYDEVLYAFDNLYLVKNKKTNLYGLVKIDARIFDEKEEVYLKEVVPCTYDKHILLSFINQNRKQEINEENNQLKLYKRYGMSGFVDSKKNLVIPLMYQKAFPFTEDLAAVKEFNTWGFINHDNETSIPFEYDYAMPFQNDLAPVRKNNKWGYINKKNEIKLPFIYDDANMFRFGYALIRIGNDYHLIDKNGNFVTTRIIEEKFIENISDIPNDIVSLNILEYLGMVELPNETVIIRESTKEDYKKAVIELETSVLSDNFETLEEEFTKKMKK